MFRFAHPEYLFLLLLIPVLIGIFIYTSIQKRKNIAKFGNPDLLAELMPNVSKIRPQLKFYLQLAAILFLIVVLAQPQFGTKVEKNKRKGIEVMIALDVSNSMMAQDVQPSRLDNAKQVLSQLVDDMTDDKIGLVVFAGDAYTQLPITVDYVSAKMFLSSISPQLVPRQGTAIGSAIDLAIKSFGTKGQAGRAIIVITDGENHEDDAVGAAKAAKAAHIIVHTIGMGLPQGVPIPMGTGGSRDYLKDRSGNIVVTKLDENMLTQIATAGGGTYIRANNAEVGLNNLFNEIEKMEKTEMDSRQYSEYNDQFPLFLTLALAMMMIDFLILERKNKWLRNFRLFGNKK